MVYAVVEIRISGAEFSDLPRHSVDKRNQCPGIGFLAAVQCPALRAFTGKTDVVGADVINPGNRITLCFRRGFIGKDPFLQTGEKFMPHSFIGKA